MATQLQIANMALSHLGQNLLANLNITNNTPGARQANLWMDQARDELLSAYNWTFATLRKRLEPKTFITTTAPSYTAAWVYYYFYPDDCVVMQYLYDPALTAITERNEPVPYSVERNPTVSETENRQLILCNAESASAVYTSNSTAYEDLPAHFIAPLTMLLAENMCFAITSSIELKTALRGLYIRNLPMYTAQDANQLTPKQEPDSQAVLAHGAF